MTTDEGTTQQMGTTEEPAFLTINGVDLSRDLVITLSCLIGGGIFTGGVTYFVYIQYCKKRGFKCGCKPCRRARNRCRSRRGKKLKDSNETLNSQDPCSSAAIAGPSKGPGVVTLAAKLQCNSVDSLDRMSETELFTAHPSGGSILPIPANDSKMCANDPKNPLNEPIPECMPEGKGPGAKNSNSQSGVSARSREYRPRSAKGDVMDEFSFDPQMTAAMARENKNK